MNKLNNDFACIGKSGIDHTQDILLGHPPHWVAVMYKKSLAPDVNEFYTANRCLCVVKLMVNDEVYLLINVYIPVDSHASSW